MVVEDFLQMGRLIESFSEVELVNTEATLALGIFVTEDLWVSKQAIFKKAEEVFWDCVTMFFFSSLHSSLLDHLLLTWKCCR